MGRRPSARPPEDVAPAPGMGMEGDDEVGMPIADVPERATEMIVGTSATWGVEPAERVADIMAKWPDVFMRFDGVELVWLDDRGRENVRPVVRSMSPPLARGLLNARRVAFGERERGKDGKWATRSCPPPNLMLERLVSTMPGEGWRVLEGVVSSPYMLADGSLVTAPGFRDGLWLSKASTVSLDRVIPAARPRRDGYTREEAAEAAEVILQDLGGIEWATPGDRSAAFAYFLTLVTRPAYRLCPIFLFTAPRSGSGKDLVAKCMEEAVYGMEACRVTPPPGRADESAAELDKRLGAAILSGESTIVIGDARQLISPTIYGLTTEARPMGLRILGQSTPIKSPKNLILAGVGNNPVLGIDVVRRAVSVRIVPKTDKPMLRKFDLSEDELKERYRERRPHFLGAAINIVRGAMACQDEAFREQVRTMIPCPFSGWAKMVQAACIFAGLPDPLESRSALEQRVSGDDPATALAQLMSAWWSYRGTMRVTATQAIAPMHVVNEDYSAKLYSEALNGIDQKLTAQGLGRLLSAADESTFHVNTSDGEGVIVQLRLTKPGNVAHYELRRL